LAPGDLIQADLHRAVITTRLRAHPPAQVDRLETGTSFPAKLRQNRKDLLVERPALGLHILKCRTHEYPEYWNPRAH